MPFVAHTGLCVSDIARSARFYSELLGFAHCRRLEMGAEAVSDFLDLDPPGNDLKALYLSLGDFQLELLQYDPAGADRVRIRKMSETGLTHISLGVESVAAILDRLADFGGELVSTIGETAAMIRDPDGQFVELLEAAGAAQERLRRD
jgi:catechol 2,3-dioxygenase-like lactoylglutathione lyase family enzyme